jgi:hypothetical protein
MTTQILVVSPLVFHIDSQHENAGDPKGEASHIDDGVNLVVQKITNGNF